jgi:hypothetical protein
MSAHDQAGFSLRNGKDALVGYFSIASKFLANSIHGLSLGEGPGAIQYLGARTIKAH